jgi:hypothetical protein
VAATVPGSVFGVIDPFANSCNGLFSILRHLPGADGLGFEFEQAIFEMTTHNIALLAAPIRLVHGDSVQCSANTASRQIVGSWLSSLRLGRTR